MNNYGICDATIVRCFQIWFNSATVGTYLKYIIIHIMKLSNEDIVRYLFAIYLIFIILLSKNNEQSECSFKFGECPVQRAVE